MRLKGKVAVVTGAASGMGKEIAKAYAREGAKVVLADLNVEAARKISAEITAEGGIATAVPADVTKEEDVQNMINTAVRQYGTLDILVNNAGIMDNFVPAAELTDRLWEKVMAVNVTGPMRTTRKALPIFLAKEQGVIINIASLGGLYGSRAGAAYTASKHAVIGFTKNVGFQYAPKGIRCNAIAPGAVKTAIGTTINAPDKFGMERAMAGINLNPKTGEPEEIAQIAVFLGAAESSLINGAVITADGGWGAY